MTPKWSNLNIVLGYWNESMNQGFRFNIQKFKNLNLFCTFDKIKYFLCKIKLAKLFSIKFSVDSCYFFTIFPQKIQKSLIITTKTCTQIHIFKCFYFDGGKRFRWCRKNKKCSIFHDLSEYIIFHMVVNYWTGPLTCQTGGFLRTSGFLIHFAK